MANDIGRKGPSGTLHLITGDEFQWMFEWAPDGVNVEPFPSGTTIQAQFGNGKKWNWVVSGSVASITIPATEADLIEDREPFIFKVNSKVVSFGLVKRWGNR